MSQLTKGRHSGTSQNPVKTIAYWMQVFVSTIAMGLESLYFNIMRKTDVANTQCCEQTFTAKGSFTELTLLIYSSILPLPSPNPNINSSH